MDKLLQVASELLGPKGCPWDLKQTYFTLQPFILEEAHELLEAIDINDSVKIKEELGDLLYGIVFVSKLAEKEGDFAFSDVAKCITEKLIRRHPHVFGEAKVSSVDDIVSNWEKIKKNEKGYEGRKSALDGIPATLPLLAKAQKMLHKMRKRKDFLPFQKSKEAVDEESMGQKLLEMIYQMDEAGLDAESLLRRALRKYENEFRATESV